MSAGYQKRMGRSERQWRRKQALYDFLPPGFHFLGRHIWSLLAHELFVEGLVRMERGPRRTWRVVPGKFTLDEARSALLARSRIWHSQQKRRDFDVDGVLLVSSHEMQEMAP